MKYQTIYETSYGVIKAVFKKEMSFKEAEKLGKEYCQENHFKYIETAEV